MNMCQENIDRLRGKMDPVRPAKPPPDGPGPRGLPDSYHMPRVLHSTARYDRFVKKLRATEEEQRKGQLNLMKELKDQQISDFFIRCDRRSLINNVARRVELCMKSYEDDLADKRRRLLDLFAKEEARDIEKFVVQVQKGAEDAWDEKMKRLQYLLDKRKREHEEKYKDTPISKCADITPYLYKHRAKEAQQIQLYQMKEKQARKLAELELDKMWYECGMKESEALAARMEQDAIERYRRDLDCKQHSDQLLEQRRRQQQREREQLKREQLALMEQFEREEQKEREVEKMKQQQAKDTAKEYEGVRLKQEVMAKKLKEDEKKVRETWESLQATGMMEEQAKLDLIRRKEKELDECNRHLIELRKGLEALDRESDCLTWQEGQRVQDRVDRARCDFLSKFRNTNMETRESVMKEIADRQAARDELKRKLDEENEYYRQLNNQLQELAKHKDRQDLAIKKLHQKHLLDQIQYSHTLRERAMKEEMDQYKKGLQVAKEYDDEMKRMLSKPFHTEDVHPFMKQMAKGLKMKPKCPCSKPDYCSYCTRV